MPPATPKTGVRVRDEFLNCDFSTVGQMVDFAHHPFMARVSREILEPLYQFFLRIREDFTWSPESKTKGEKRVMRQRVRDYLEMAVSPGFLFRSNLNARAFIGSLVRLCDSPS
jgi:hypothetical protein